MPPSQAESQQPYLAVSNIEVIYDHVILVLKACRFRCRRKIVALLGANGAADHNPQGDLQPPSRRARRRRPRHDRVPRARVAG